MLVEDSDDLRICFRAVLEDRGHRVSEAADGIQGVALILAEKPDVGIIDIGLPGIDGYEIARLVRAALGHSVLLIALTGHATDADRALALAAGFDTHMIKPVDIKLVVRVLDTTRPGVLARGVVAPPPRALKE